MPNKEPLFRFVLNHSQELIIRYDSYGFINYVNQKAMDTLGYTGEELQGLYIGELLKGVYCMVDNHVAFADQYRDRDCYIQKEPDLFSCCDDQHLYNL